MSSFEKKEKDIKENENSKLKINGYTIGKTLGVGTFGKVKSEYTFLFFFFFIHKCLN